MPPLDHDRCYAVVQSRDRRFDGRFVTAVRTTGIYCRPSCPAITPKRSNVEFHPTAAAAQQRGFRACKRCAPDATPGSPEWNVRNDVIARAMRLIADGEVERGGVGALASRLGYSERHLTRLFNEELGAGPLAVARAHRAQTARILVETTAMRFTDIAFAAGFGSVRQFNDTMRAVYDAAPRDLRAAAGGRATGDRVGAVHLRLPTRAPFAAEAALAFLGVRAIPGLEAWDGATYRRALRLPLGHGVVALRAADEPTYVHAELQLEHWADLAVAVQRLRRLLDLDADPRAVDQHLGADPVLAPLVAAAPGLRSVGSVDPFETAVRAIVGQQISVAGARTVAAPIVSGAGVALRIVDDVLTHAFPTADELARAIADDEARLAMPTARRATIAGLAEAVGEGRIALDVGADPNEARHDLQTIRGIGPWTADYIAMRGLGHPDILLAGDLGVRHALERFGMPVERTHSGRWSPWSSYAVHHLWQALDPATPDPVTPNTVTPNTVTPNTGTERSAP